MITTEPGDSLKIMFDFDKLSCFQGAHEYLFNTVNGFLNELFQFAYVCLNDIMFVFAIDKFLAM